MMDKKVQRDGFSGMNRFLLRRYVIFVFERFDLLVQATCLMLSRLFGIRPDRSSQMKLEVPKSQ